MRSARVPGEALAGPNCLIGRSRRAGWLPGPGVILLAMEGERRPPLTQKIRGATPLQPEVQGMTPFNFDPTRSRQIGMEVR